MNKQILLLLAIVTTVLTMGVGCATSNPITTPPVNPPTPANNPAVTTPVSTPVSEVVPDNNNPYKLVASKNVSWNEHKIVFTHGCDGTIQTVSFPGTNRATFCIGKNQLIATQDGITTTIISEENITDAGQAPMLNKVQFTSFFNPTVIVHYASDDCATTNNCGVGQGSTKSAIAYDLKTSQFYTLNNYPTDGVWNNAGTKAFIMPNNSAGAGATNDVIHGYAVGNGPGTGIVRSLTNEKASAETNNPTDVSGNPLAYWADVKWTDNNTISATLVDLQGNGNQLIINFNDLIQ